MASSENAHGPQAKPTSKQLLYCEKFEGRFEDKLRVMDKKSRTGTKPVMLPPSSVLSRMKDLLPKMAAANEELMKKPSSEYSIETADEDYDGPVIEMELALAPALETDDSDSESDSDEDQENTTSRAANTLITELPAAGQQGKPQS